MMDFDAGLTFETFVIGPANRLAAAAARRAADSPGTSYNPLFLYSASGLGKSHILAAIAHHAMRNHEDRRVVYQTLEGYLDELTKSLETGDQEGMRARYRDLEILLLDDVQFLTGQTQAQELLLRTLDSLAAQGSQVVLASDRPPAEINGLDARLLSRFSGGLIVDIGAPDYETRVAIIRRKAEERSAKLVPGVAEAMARHPFKNVRELQGAMNRVLAVQDLEDRQVTPEEVLRILGVREESAVGEPPPGASGSDAAAVARGEGGEPELDQEEGPAWRRTIRRAAREAEAEGFSAGRLRRVLDGDEAPDDPENLVASFRSELGRLREIRAEMAELGNPWPETEQTILRDPERLEEAEALLASARERTRPFPTLGSGPVLSQLTDHYPSLAVRAAERFVLQERPDYNPLFVVCPERERAVHLLQATGRTLLGVRPDARVAMVSVGEFAEDFIRAISQGVAGAWRERWWSADLFLLHGAEELSDTERAQDEFFHLFEALKRRNARILLAADRSPAEVENIDERLRSRFEGGLVVEVEGSHAKVDSPVLDADRDEEAGSNSRMAPLEDLEVEEAERGELLQDRDREEGVGPEVPAPGEEPFDAGEVARSEPHRSLAEPDPAAGDDEEADSQDPPVSGEPDEGVDDLALIREFAGIGGGAVGNGSDGDEVVVESREIREEERPRGERWAPSPEKVVWGWPRVEDRIAEEQG